MAFENSVWALVFVWLIHGAAQGFGSVGGFLLELPAVRYVGRISYGLYVVHPFMRNLSRHAFGAFGVSMPDSQPLRFLTLTAFSLAVAALSWHLLERPINDLKAAFPMPRSPRPDSGPTGATSGPRAELAAPPAAGSDDARALDDVSA